MKSRILKYLFLLSLALSLFPAEAKAGRGLYISSSATCADVPAPVTNFTYCLPAQGANKNQLLVWNGSAFVAAISGTGSAYATVQDEGTPLTQRSTLNFTGTGVTCTDNAGNASTDCDIPGGGGGSSAFNDLIGGTNTTAAMVVGTGASISTSGSGTIAATTSAALAANGSNCAAGQAAAGVDASGAAEGCTDYAEEPAASGLIAKTAANTTAARTITGTANQITVTNGSGVSGNPTLSIPTSPTLPGTTTGTFSGNLTGNVTGNASTATALAANGANCTAGNAPLGVDASGAAEGCFDVATQAELNTHAGLTGSSAHGATSANTASQIVTRDASGNFSAGTVTAALSGNASTATALAANGTNCGLGEAAQGIDASGNAEGCFTPAGGGGGANIILDLGDDGANESTTLSEIATTGDTNSIFTEPSADKLLIDLSKKWPAADTATTASALASNPADCSSNQYANAIAANGDLTCAQPASTQLSDTSDLVRNNAGNTYSTGAQDFGSATSLKVPTAAGASPTASGNIAYDSTSNTLEAGVNGANKTVAFTDSNISGNAGTATALAANGANCSAGQAPLGVDASGAAEGCFDVATQTELDNHISDTTAAHAASAISNTPVGNIAATDVQAAINELDTEKQPAGSYITGAGGSDTQVQRNNSGSFGGISGFTSDGTNVTAGSGNLRATSPRITTGINDANGNPAIAISPTASAVDGITIINAATANPATVSITASGSDSNINLQLLSKGTGTVQVGAASAGNKTTITSASLTADRTFTTPDADSNPVQPHTCTSGDFVSAVSAAGVITCTTPASGGAPTTAHYVTTQAESGLSAEANLGALTTGLLKHSVSAGVSTPATAVAGTDYAAAPTGSANTPLFNDGSGGFTNGTRSGNTTKVVTMDASSPATNDCAKFDASGNLTTAGAACGSGGGSRTLTVVTHSTNQTIARDGAFHALAFDTDLEDPNGWHDTVTNNSRITFGAAAKCVVSATVNWDSGGASPSAEIALKLNGTTYLATGIANNIASGSTVVALNLARLRSFGNGDYIEVYVADTAGSGNGTASSASEYSPIFSADCS